MKKQTFDFTSQISHIIILCIVVVFANTAECESLRILKGVYLFAQKVKDYGTPDVNQRSVPVPIQKGKLSDGDINNPGDGIVFPTGYGSDLKKSVVFDLLEDRVIQDVILIAKVENESWGATQIDVSYRSEEDAKYRLLDRRQFVREKSVYTFDFRAAKARFIKIDMWRNSNDFLIVPMNEVIINSASPPEGDLEKLRPLSVADLKNEFKKEPVIIDKYGQFLNGDWPEKIKADSDFARDIEVEARKFAEWGHDNRTYDKYGGLVDAKKFESTGFFRLTKDGGRWFFVTPDGNRFLLIGVDAVDCSEWGVQTPVYYPGTKNVRTVFEELPDPNKFSQAYCVTDWNHEYRVDFLNANLQRKYGLDFQNKWVASIRQRLKILGFDGVAKWSRHSNLKLPYITVLEPDNAKRILWAVDPFDPGFEASVERGVKEKLCVMKDDKFIIGHTFENESGWNREIVQAFLADVGGTSSAKRRFIEFLLLKEVKTFPELCKIFSVRAESMEQLMRAQLKLPKALEKDADQFIAAASKEYYRIVCGTIRKYDPNHLILGSSLSSGPWRSSEEWIAGGIEYLDGISIDTYQLDWKWVQPYTKYEKPILLLEFSLFQWTHGLKAHESPVPSQKARGLYYRFMVENLFAQPAFVGTGWFFCYDSSVVGTWIDGEAYNAGLFNVSDQPYYDMLEQMVITNRRVMGLHSGELKPVSEEIVDGIFPRPRS